MKKHEAPHTNRKRHPSNHDANFRIPSSLTQLVRCRLLSEAWQHLEYACAAQGIEHPWSSEVLPDFIDTEDFRAWLLCHADKFGSAEFKVIYLGANAFSKYVDKSTDPAELRQRRAISKWLAQERDNEATNDRLTNLPEDYMILPRVSWSRFRDKVCQIVTGVIGDTPPTAALRGGFSGGASTTKSRTDGHPSRKYIGEAHITSAAVPWFEASLTEAPGWAAYAEELIVDQFPGNVLFTVPKTSTIDRCCCKEPDLNMYLQKGVGMVIRRALRKVGIDLNDQSRNQRLARLGSRDGSLATLDLSSASDSISREVVFQFLPPAWFVLLDALRSPVTLIDGEVHVNEMFSSMGNGFTFELESLLFYALVAAVAYFEGTSGTISVYGDDIIAPSSLMPQIHWAFHVLGFKVNETKSFYKGPFRESCGGHFHSGERVTPFYVREPLERLTDLIRVLNHIRRWAVWDVNDGDFAYDPLGSEASSFLWGLEDLWKDLSTHVPRRFWGGRDLGSVYQLVSPDRPYSRLVPITNSRKTGLGGYLHWLDSTSWDEHFLWRDTRWKGIKLRPWLTTAYVVKRLMEHRQLPNVQTSEASVVFGKHWTRQCSRLYADSVGPLKTTWLWETWPELCDAQ